MDEKIRKELEQALAEVENLKERLTSLLSRVQDEKAPATTAAAHAAPAAVAGDDPFYTGFLQGLAAGGPAFRTGLWLPPAVFADLQDENLRRLLPDLTGGDSPIGFHLALRRAQTPRGHVVGFFLLEDMYTEKMLIVGNAGVDDDLIRSLRAAKSTYVLQGDPSAAEDIGDFLARSAKERRQSAEAFRFENRGVEERLREGFAVLTGIDQSGTLAESVLKADLSADNSYAPFFTVAPTPAVAPATGTPAQN